MTNKNADKLIKLFNIHKLMNTQPKHAKKDWKQLGYKQDLNKDRINRTICSLSTKGVPDLTIAQSVLILHSIIKYELKPLSKNDLKPLSSIEFKARSVADNTISTSTKLSEQVAVANHQTNDRMGIEITWYHNKKLDPITLYNVETLKPITKDDVIKEIKHVITALIKEQKK